MIISNKIFMNKDDQNLQIYDEIKILAIEYLKYNSNQIEFKYKRSICLKKIQFNTDINQYLKITTYKLYYLKDKNEIL